MAVEVLLTEPFCPRSQVAVMKNKKKNIFSLDRDGGREKINRALYSPQQYRHENSHGQKGRGWSFILAVIIGVVLGWVFYLIA
ncbi:MAG TPA: hypothetical protein VGU61_18730 [Noviherbaspirillum sp.]|uniref:hypothetical protein n=1 Tax=Noviherbaspirillum sp. TaxID=1926288 RepID=UPI002DDCE888|nr:hypothetical protein [Noviherbaspirillum sp.]HEV2612305.1 hypothetical protein [Noviherbaspirillum sp.]